MSKDNERYDYHYDNWNQKKVRENYDLRKNRIDKSSGSTETRQENDTSPTSPTSPLHLNKSEKDARMRMDVKKGDVRAEISKCRDLRQGLKDDLSRRLSDIDLTLPDADTKLKDFAKEVGETAQEKHDLYFRGLKTSTADVIREDLWSIRKSLLELADKATEYQIDFRRQE